MIIFYAGVGFETYFENKFRNSPRNFSNLTTD